MGHEFFARLIQNISLLLVFSYLYNSNWLNNNTNKEIIHKAIAGVILGFMGILLMKTPWIYQPGISFDTRSILLSVSALFLGFIPSAIAMAITFMYRFSMGGDGVYMGIMVIISSGLIGLIWRYFFKEFTKKKAALSFLTMGFIVHFVMLIWTSLLPDEKSLNTLYAIAIPTLSIYPMGTMLLGILLNKQQLNWENRKAKESLLEMDRRFSDMMKNVQLISVILDTNGKIIFCNEYLLRITGFLYEEIINKNWFEIFIPQETRAKVYKTTNKIIQGDSILYFENEICTKSGEKLLIAWSNTLLKDENGETEAIAAIGENITDKKRYIEALKKSKSKFNTLFNASPDAIMITRMADNIISNVNKSACLISGYQRHDFIGKTIYQSNIWHNKKQIAEYTALMDAEKKVSNFEAELQMKDNSVKTVLISGEITEIHNELFIMAVVRDITERKNAEKAIQQKTKETAKLNKELAETISKLEMLNKELIVQKEKAEESNRLKSAFLQNMSHEIRTPMNAIIGFTGFLAKNNIVPEKKAHFIEIIQNSAEQLLAVVTNILTVSSLETKQEKPEYLETDIFQLFNEMHSIFELQASKKNIALISNIAIVVEESLVITDKTMLIQIISNLLNNAIKFTEQGSVELGVFLKETVLNFYVKDTGIGIKPEYQHIIFERFNQAEISIQTKYGGTGLGLSICKGFVELLGGKIWVESMPGNGTTFHFTLPYKPVRIKKNILSLTSEKLYKPKTILVAEDEENNFLFLEEFLNYMEIKVLRAANGKIAIEMIQDNTEIDLVLMDIKMPVMSGEKAAAEIKKRRTNLPIIAQTAYAMEYEVYKYNNIFDDYITKPIQISELKNKLSKYNIV